MKRIARLYERFPVVGLVLLMILFVCVAVPLSACTIFVLVDGSRVLFFNNEDWYNPKTRIWFVPAGNGYYGCAYVGYDDGWARGGVNTEGLACDWVGGFTEKWEADPRTGVRGNPTQRLLESCSSVEEAIAFFQTHRESDFSRAKILIADRTGASVIIGANDGKLQFEKANLSRGFGYANRTLQEMLPILNKPTVANGATILRACLQKGQYATKYSNIFDLKSGDIFLYQFYERDDSVKLNLAAELKKGGHYFDMPQIRRQLAQPPLALLINMKRFFLDEFPPIPDPDPTLTDHIRNVTVDAMRGTMQQEDYSVEFWKAISPAQKDIKTDLKRYGEFVSIELVEHKNESGNQSNRYRLEFQNATLLMRYVLNEHNKVVLIQSDGAERKPGADLGE
jgi:hypothetical protein